MENNPMYMRIRDILVEQFDVEASVITPDAKLYDELEIDSIDGVDLMVQLKQMTGKKLAPEAFKEVRTIRDLLDALQDL